MTSPVPFWLLKNNEAHISKIVKGLIAVQDHNKNLNVAILQRRLSWSPSKADGLLTHSLGFRGVL